MRRLRLESCQALDLLGVVVAVGKQSALGLTASDESGQRSLRAVDPAHELGGYGGVLALVEKAQQGRACERPRADVVGEAGEGVELLLAELDLDGLADGLG